MRKIKKRYVIAVSLYLLNISAVSLYFCGKQGLQFASSVFILLFIFGIQLFIFIFILHKIIKYFSSKNKKLNQNWQSIKTDWRSYKKIKK